MRRRWGRVWPRGAWRPDESRLDTRRAPPRLPRSAVTISRAGWVSSYALKTGVSSDASVVSRLVANESAMVPGSNGTLSPGTSTGVEWRNVALLAGIPVEANASVDVTSTTAGSAYSCAVVQGSCDDACNAIVAFNVSVRTPTANLSSARGTLVTLSAPAFTSDYLVVPFDGFLTDYSVSTAHTGRLYAYVYTVVAGAAVQVYIGQVAGMSGGMRVHPIGIARDNWVPVTAGSLVYILHRDAGNSPYSAATNGATDSALVTLTFRPQEPVDVYSNVPATVNTTQQGTSFSAGPWNVTLPGFLDSIDILVASLTQTTPYGAAAACTLTVAVTRGGTSTGLSASGPFERRYGSSTAGGGGPNPGNTPWQGVSLVPSLALYAGDALHVSHSCGGTRYASYVTPAGQAVMTFGIARAPAA